MPSSQKRSNADRTSGLPDRETLLAYLAKNDGVANRRDIARAFNVKGEDRAVLRIMLKELEAEGVLEKTGRARYGAPASLPSTGPVDVLSVDDDGDLLCVPAAWRFDTPPPMIRINARHAENQRTPPGVGDRLLVRLSNAGDDSYDAKIIKAIGKSAHRFLAVFRKKRSGGIAEPVERRARNSFTIERQDCGGAKDGDLVWVETKNARGYGSKKARVRSIEGHIDSQGAFSLIALANHQIPQEFPSAVMREADAQKLPPLGDREDLRTLPLITIDPADARDHDDAVYACKDDDPANEGGFKVFVAIADVSYFVRPGSALDKEALNRGNSTYLPDRVVPMLPERLSNDLCSLREGEDRPCLAVELTLSAQGVLKHHRFTRAIMRSAAKLAYEEAQAIIDGKMEGASTIIADNVRLLYDAYRARLTERAKRAPLDLELPERKILLNTKGMVKQIKRKQRFDAHKIVEEFMILANVAAAITLERKKLSLIYRVHDQPDEEKLDSVRDYLATIGYSLTKGGVRPGHFNQLLKIAEERDEKEMVSDVILRAQSQAVYDTDNLGHFGLNLPRYAHFTSPIRRYADLTVHRALVSAGGFGDGGQTPEEAKALPKIADQISNFERRSIAAERETNDRFLAAYHADKIGTVFEARIRGVTRFGLFVMLEESGADGFIPIRTLGFERFRHEEDHHALIGETTGGVFRLGQAVEVRLAEATPLTGGLRFDMLSDPLNAAPSTAKRASRKSKSRKKTSSRKSAPPKGKSTRGKKPQKKNKKPKR